MQMEREPWDHPVDQPRPRDNRAGGDPPRLVEHRRIRRTRRIGVGFGGLSDRQRRRRRRRSDRRDGPEKRDMLHRIRPDGYGLCVRELSDGLSDWL
eukprot:6599935-Pyramimonas_sp.AAC.1